MGNCMFSEKKRSKNIAKIDAKIKLVVKSGKFTLGYKSAIKSLRSGNSKLILISNNCHPIRKSELEYYAMLCKTGVHHYSGNNLDLGTACGKKFRVCSMSINDPADSEIIQKLD